jgi:hypothetical protein
VTPPGPSLQPPRRDLAEFPAITLQSGDSVYRAHGDKGPWYFSQSGGGRFDITTDPRTGTCYVASDEEVAVREVLRDEWLNTTQDAVLLASVTRRRVSTLEIPRAFRLADLLSDDANGYGLNREVMADPRNYSVAQHWAAAFHEAGFDGIYYEPRNTLGKHRWAAALFDTAGSKTPADGYADATTTTTMEDAAARAGIHVIQPGKSSAGLTVISPM